MFRVDICRMNVHIEQITLNIDMCTCLNLNDCSQRAVCGVMVVSSVGTPARSLGGVHEAKSKLMAEEGTKAELGKLQV